MPFVEVFDLLVYRFRRNGEGIQETYGTLKKGWEEENVERTES